MLNDGVEIGELAGLLFGVEFLFIDADFEDAAACRNKRERTDALFEIEKLHRQTDGFRLVVSSRAIFDRDFWLHLPGNLPTPLDQVKVVGSSAAFGTPSVRRDL